MHFHFDLLYFFKILNFRPQHFRCGRHILTSVLMFTLIIHSTPVKLFRFFEIWYKIWPAVICWNLSKRLIFWFQSTDLRWTLLFLFSTVLVLLTTSGEPSTWVPLGQLVEPDAFLPWFFNFLSIFRNSQFSSSTFLVWEQDFNFGSFVHSDH